MKWMQLPPAPFLHHLFHRKSISFFTSCQERRASDQLQFRNHSAPLWCSSSLEQTYLHDVVTRSKAAILVGCFALQDVWDNHVRFHDESKFWQTMETPFVYTPAMWHSMVYPLQCMHVRHAKTTSIHYSILTAPKLSILREDEQQKQCGRLFLPSALLSLFFYDHHLVATDIMISDWCRRCIYTTPQQWLLLVLLFHLFELEGELLSIHLFAPVLGWTFRLSASWHPKHKAVPNQREFAASPLTCWAKFFPIKGEGRIKSAINQVLTAARSKEEKCLFVLLRIKFTHFLPYEHMYAANTIFPVAKGICRLTHQTWKCFLCLKFKFLPLGWCDLWSVKVPSVTCHL